MLPHRAARHPPRPPRRTEAIRLREALLPSRGHSPAGVGMFCRSFGSGRGRRTLLKRWHILRAPYPLMKRRLRRGPPYPGDMSHPSGRHPVFTQGSGTSMCHLGHIPRAQRPSRTYRSWLRSEKQTRATPYYRRRAVEPSSRPWSSVFRLPSSVFRLPSSVKAGSHLAVGCDARQPGDRSAAPNAPKDAVLPHWGSSGTWRCRARELRPDADVSDDPQCGRTAAPSGAVATKRS